jgi:hypothetical protein
MIVMETMEDVIGKKVEITSDVQTIDNELVVEKRSVGVVVGSGFGFYDIKFENIEAVQVVFAKHCKILNKL